MLPVGPGIKAAVYARTLQQLVSVAGYDKPEPPVHTDMLPDDLEVQVRSMFETDHSSVRWIKFRTALEVLARDEAGNATLEEMLRTCLALAPAEKPRPLPQPAVSVPPEYNA